MRDAVAVRQDGGTPDPGAAAEGRRTLAEAVGRAIELGLGRDELRRLVEELVTGEGESNVE